MNETRVLGTVTAKHADGDALVLVVSVTNGQYTDTVACRFWKDKATEAAVAQEGNVVLVCGSVRSKESKTPGKYFSDLSCFRIQVIA